MTDYNQQNNRLVWFDIPVANLDRASRFYAAVLGVGVEQQSFGDIQFSVIEHKDGNGGCLVPNENEVSQIGVLIYLNAEGRIRDAVQKVKDLGGSVTEDVHVIGPHGFRAIVVDSESNRVALHSMVDQ